MVNKRTYVDHLSEVLLFSDFSRKDLERVAAAGDHVTLHDGRSLFVQDDTGREAFVILTGKVKLARNGRTVATVGPGAVVGEMSLLDQGPRSASATCVGDCDVLVLSRARFRALIEQVPAMSHKLLASLAGRVRDLDSKSYG